MGWYKLYSVIGKKEKGYDRWLSDSRWPLLHNEILFRQALEIFFLPQISLKTVCEVETIVLDLYCAVMILIWNSITNAKVLLDRILV